MGKKKYAQLETKALWTNNNATEKCEVTYAFTDRADGNFKIGKSNILGENVALTIGCDGVIHGTFEGTFNGGTGDCCVGGKDGDIQYNDDGEPAGDDRMTFDPVVGIAEFPVIRVPSIGEFEIPVATADGTLEGDSGYTWTDTTTTLTVVGTIDATKVIAGAGGITLGGVNETTWPGGTSTPSLGPSGTIQVAIGDGTFGGDTGFTYVGTDVTVASGRNLKLTELAANEVVYSSDSDGTLAGDGGFTWDGSDVKIGNGAAFYIDDLGEDQVMYSVDDDGQVVGADDFTFNGDILTAPTMSAGVITLDGDSRTTWPAETPPVGSDNDVQTKDGTGFYGDSGFTYDGTDVTVGGSQDLKLVKLSPATIGYHGVIVASDSDGTLGTDDDFTFTQGGGVGIGPFPGFGADFPSASLQVMKIADAADDADCDAFPIVAGRGTNTNGAETGIGFRIDSAWGSKSPGGALTFERTGADSIGKLHFKTAETANTITTRMTIEADGAVAVVGSDLTVAGVQVLTTASPTGSPSQGDSGDVQTSDGSGDFLGDNGFTYNGTNVTIATGKKLFLTDLPAGRVMLGGTSGEVTEDADLTYSGDTLSTPTASVGDELTVGTSTGMSFSNTSGDFSVGTSQLVVEGATGDVGIGIANPAVRLDINETNPGGACGVRIQNASSVEGSQCRIHMRGSTTDFFWQLETDPPEGGGAVVAFQKTNSDEIKSIEFRSTAVGEPDGNYFSSSAWQNPDLKADDKVQVGVCGDESELAVVTAAGATWGAKLALKEISNDRSTYTDGWGIYKNTAAASANASGINFSYGTNTDVAANTSQVEFSTVGKITCAGGLSADSDFFNVDGTTQNLVGINTNVQISSEKLSIVSGDDRDNIVLIWGDSNAAGEPYMGLGVNTGRKVTLLAGTSNGTTATDLEIQTANPSGVETLHVTFNGSDQSTDFEGNVDVDGVVTADNIFTPAYAMAYQIDNTDAVYTGNTVLLFNENPATAGAGGTVGEYAARNMTFSNTTGQMHPDTTFGGSYLIEAQVNFSTVEDPTPSLASFAEIMEIQEDGGTRAIVYFDLDGCTHASGTMSVPISAITSVADLNEITIKWIRHAGNTTKYGFVAPGSTFKMTKLE